VASWYKSKGYIDKALATMEEAAAADASNPQSHQLLATFYEELVRKGNPGPVDRATYIANGIAAADRALALRPDYVEALIYKNLLLRHQAADETNAARKQAVLAEADTLRSRAMELRGTPPPPPPPPSARQGRAMPPPPPPPPPPPGGKEPVRIGGEVKPPRKIRDVPPVYPPIAQAANVQGVVILETLIDESGDVIWTKVLRSIPLLDEAAQTAVQQWKFTPTRVDGEPVPVIMVTTVNFVMQ
jgi:TonB family protein